MLQTGRAQTIVAVYAHPDDGEFHAAGSLAKWARAGHRVVALCATDGALGTKRSDLSSAQVAATRAEELRAALSQLGAEPPVLLGFPDGFLREHYQALRERLVYHLRRLRADRVVTFDPYKRYELHPDHLTVGLMASEAAAFACFPLLYPEQLQSERQLEGEECEAWQPREVWYMGPLERPANRVIDIAATLDQKVAALLSHSSQLELLADWFVPGADPRALTADQLSRLRDGARRYVLDMARSAAAPYRDEVQAAECFYALRVGPGHFDQHRASVAGASSDEPVELG